jgi:hypothetical protein
MTVVDAPWGPVFPERPAWSGVGAEFWDGTVCPDDLRLVSASSVPKALASPALERWAITTTIEKLAERLPQFQALVAQDMDAAVNWANQLRYQPEAGAELNAADSGSALHSLLEAWMQHLTPAPELVAQIQRDPVLTQMATLLWGWYSRFKPTPVEIERVVYDPANGIAGRLDAIVRFEAMPEMGNVLLDLKTSRSSRHKSGGKKRLFGDSHALQLACYRYAPLMATFEPRIATSQRATSNRTYLLSPREVAVCAPAVEIQSTCILKLDPEGAVLHPIETGAGVHRRAIQAVGLHQWISEESKAVVGQPISPPIVLPDLS